MVILRVTKMVNKIFFWNSKKKFRSGLKKHCSGHFLNWLGSFFIAASILTHRFHSQWHASWRHFVLTPPLPIVQWAALNLWPWLLKVNSSFKNNYLTCFSISHLMVKILKQLLQIKFGFIKNQLANQIHRFKKLSEKCKSREMETGKRSTTFNSLQFATFINVLIYIFIWKKEWKLVTSTA